MHTDVIVVGAGLSGLVTAFRLKCAGRAVTVLEEAPRAGGVIGSQRRDGALLERGPNSGLDTTPLIDRLLHDIGIADQRLNATPAAARRYVIRGGQPVAMPTSPGAFLATRLFSTRAKLRLFAEPFIGRAPAEMDESIAQFVRRRLGREFLDYAIEPFVAGIYAGDPERLSVPAAFPRLHALEQRYGSLIKGAVLGARERARSAEKGKNAANSFSFHEGMQTLTDALARAIGRIDCHHKVTAINRGPDGRYSVASDHQGRSVLHTAPVVIIATPAYAAAGLVASVDADAAAALRAIEYAPVAVVVQSFRRSDVGHPLDGFGFLAPRVEATAVLGTLFSSTMFDGRAPDGTAVLTTFVGGRRDPAAAALPETELLQRVGRELARLLNAHADPQWSHVTRWPRAIPQYDLGHRQRLATLDNTERKCPGLYFCANYRGGVSIGDCVKSGHAMAERVLAGRSASPSAVATASAVPA